MSMEYSWKDDGGKPKHLEEISPCATLPTTNPTWSILASDSSYCVSIVQGVRNVTVHLQKVLEVMSMSVFTGLNAFNFIRKHFLQICL